jgi:hypothetical protein
MILMLFLSAESENSALPSPSVLEQTESGTGQFLLSQPSSALQTLHANLDLTLPLGQYKATTLSPLIPNPTVVVLLQIMLTKS